MNMVSNGFFLCTDSFVYRKLIVERASLSHMEGLGFEMDINLSSLTKKYL
jgi:hypothetical protein